LKQQSATGPYFLGEQFSLADIALAPFVLRTEAFTKLVLDGYKFDAIKNSPRLASFYEGVTSRPSAKETYYGDREYLTLAINKFNLDIKL
jgi:glutathione S-transferase